MSNEEFQNVVLQQLKSISEEQKQLRKDIAGLELRMENEVIEKVRILFDANQIQEDRHKEMTKQFADHRKETSEQFSELRHEMAEQLADHRKETAEQFSELRHEVAEQLADHRKETAEQFADLRQEMTDRFKETGEQFTEHRRDTTERSDNLEGRLSSIETDTGYLVSKVARLERIVR